MTTRRRRAAGVLAAAVTAVVLAAGCGTTDEPPQLISVQPAESELTDQEPLALAALEEAAANQVEPSYVATATATEISAEDRSGGSIEVFAEAGDDEPSQTIGNPVDGEGLAVAPVVFLAVEQPAPDADWIEVNLPVRPNGSTGWVRAEDVQLSSHDFRIEVRIAEHRIVVTEGDEVALDAPAGVGTSQTPTPGGTFYTRSLIRSTNPAYGPFAYGLSGYSEVHETFGNGPGDIGIHGTDDEAAVGSDVSNGCIRLHNDDIEALSGVLPLGVPVDIVA